MAELFSTSQVWASPVRFRSASYRSALEHLRRSPGRVRTLASGQGIGNWRALYPLPSDHFPKADDNALVLKGELDGTRVLLCSDLGRAGQSALLERALDLQAEIVVAGLPGGSEPLGDALLEAIQPRLIIIADSDFPASERAAPKLQKRLALRQIPTIYTRSAGAVTIDFRARKWAARTMSGQRIKGSL